MDGHTKRTLKKQNDIKRAALELFNQYGAARVSLEEIARQANVSKVTLYKYFENKDGLYIELIKMIFDENLAALQDVLENERPFREKLVFLIGRKSNALQYLHGDFVQELVRSEPFIEEYIEQNYAKKIRQLVFKFVEQGKSEGYIDSSLNNETVSLYIDIFKAGLKEISSKQPDIIEKQETFDELIDVFFHGLIRKPSV